MIIVDDLGHELVNSDNVFTYQIRPAGDGSVSLVAFAPVIGPSGALVAELTRGSKERCEKALDAVKRGLAKDAALVDLIGILGERPKVTVPPPKLIVPGNGDGHP